MDPISALGLGCNILTLVGQAITCGRIVKQIYDSADGLQKAHETVGIQADRMKEVINFLWEQQSEIAAAEDEKLKEIASRCVRASEQLRAVIDDCRAKDVNLKIYATGKAAFKSLWNRDKSAALQEESEQPHGVLADSKAKDTNLKIYAAGKAAFKSFRNRDRIVALQEELKSCQSDLQSFIGIATRGDVAKVLHVLEGLSIRENSELMTSLNRMEGRLKDALIGPTDSQETFQEALDMIRDGIILEALHSEVLGQRFHEVQEEYPGTFKWIFDDPAFVHKLEPKLAISFPNWLQTGRGVFHIAGKPGSGKSTLMKYLYGHKHTRTLLEEWARSGDRRLLLSKFFFWRIGVGYEQKSLNGLIRGLLYEILCEVPRLARILFPRHWKRASHSVRGMRRIQIQPDEMVVAFSRLVASSESSDRTDSMEKIRLCLFIDGLDEFEDTTGGRLLTHGGLAKLLQSWAQGSDGNVKICASSRIEAPFMDNFSIKQRLTLNKLTTQDIHRVVTSELGGHENFKLLQAEHQAECKKLLEKITDRADGVFLWVALLLKDLCQGLERLDTLDVLQERVNLAPPELDNFLGQILQRIDPVYRKGVYLLIAVVLRTTGTVLSTEPREAQFAYFDTLEFPYGYGESEFNLSVLSCFAILWTSRKGIDMDADLELNDLTFLNTDPNGWSATIRAQCNGLLDVLENGYVKFMHRSIPEFLQKNFSREHKSYTLDDFKVTETMVWSYLVEVKYLAAQPASDRATESQAAPGSRPLFLSRDSRFDSKFRPDGDDKDQPPSDSSVTEDTADDSSDDTASRPGGNSTGMARQTSIRRLESWHPRPRTHNDLFIFLCRVRQIKLEDEAKCWSIFRLLLSIKDTMDNNPEQWPVETGVVMPALGAGSQSMSLLYQSTTVGLHEFISWVFRQPQVAISHDDILKMAYSAVESFYARHGTPFSVGMLEVLFSNGVKTDVVFPEPSNLWLEARAPTGNFAPRGTNPCGKPLWHAFLLHLPYYFNYSSPVMWQAIQVWLKWGANAQAGVRFDMDGRRRAYFTALDARDGSGAIGLYDISNVVAFSWELDNFVKALERQRGELHFPITLDLSLRDLVTLMRPNNERELLELIDMQTSSKAQAGESGAGRLPEDQDATVASELSKPEHDAGPLLNASELDKTLPTRWPQEWRKNLVWICLNFVLVLGAGVFLARWYF